MVRVILPTNALLSVILEYCLKYQDVVAMVALTKMDSPNLHK